MLLQKETKGYQTLNVHNKIKRKIITLEYKPGEILNENRLERELGVGRTPIREALLTLKAENLVENRPNQPFFVKEITFKSVRDFFEVFVVMEKLATCLAGQRITQETVKEVKSLEAEVDEALRRRDYWEITHQNRKFHRLIAQASDNDYIFSIYENLRNQAERLSYLATSRELQNSAPLEEHLSKIRQHHHEIVSCLEMHQVDRLETLSEEHAKLFQDRILNYLTTV